MIKMWKKEGDEDWGVYTIGQHTCLEKMLKMVFIQRSRIFFLIKKKVKNMLYLPHEHYMLIIVIYLNQNKTLVNS